MTLRVIQVLVVLIPALLIAFVLAPGASSNAATQDQLVSDGVPAHTPITDPAALSEARRLQQLGVSQEMNGRLSEAVETQQKALDLLRAATGANHPLVVAQSDRLHALRSQLVGHPGGSEAR